MCLQHFLAFPCNASAAMRGTVTVGARTSAIMKMMIATTGTAVLTVAASCCTVHRPRCCCCCCCCGDNYGFPAVNGCNQRTSFPPVRRAVCSIEVIVTNSARPKWVGRYCNYFVTLSASSGTVGMSEDVVCQLVGRCSVSPGVVCFTCFVLRGSRAEILVVEAHA